MQTKKGEIMKTFLRAFGLIGAIVFGVFFSFTYGVPGYVEEIAKEFIEQQVEKEVNEKLDAADRVIENKTLSKLAGALLKKNAEDIAAIRKNLKDGLHEKIAESIAKMRDLNCECRKKYENYIKAGMKYQIFSMEKANEQLLEFIKGKYMQVVKKLATDVRIVTGSNVVLFLLLVLLTFLKPKGITHLFLPGVLLLISTLVCTYFYVFEQNWFFTIIYNDYVGWGYLGYVGVLFAVLCDIAFNKGRVTTNILNSVLNAVGSVEVIVPC